MSETLGLKNVNMLSKERYSEINEPATDELYAISGSGFGFPSDRYDDLELGASGTTYTAPSNGWFALQKTSGTNQGYIYFRNTKTGLSLEWNCTVSSYVAKLFIPCKKGDVVICGYNLTGATDYFRFIYAEGE